MKLKSVIRRINAVIVCMIFILIFYDTSATYAAPYAGSTVSIDTSYIYLPSMSSNGDYDTYYRYTSYYDFSSAASITVSTGMYREGDDSESVYMYTYAYLVSASGETISSATVQQTYIRSSHERSGETAFSGWKSGTATLSVPAGDSRIKNARVKVRMDLGTKKWDSYSNRGYYRASVTGVTCGLKSTGATPPSNGTIHMSVESSSNGTYYVSVSEHHSGQSASENAYASVNTKSDLAYDLRNATSLNFSGVSTWRSTGIYGLSDVGSTTQTLSLYDAETSDLIYSQSIPSSGSVDLESINSTKWLGNVIIKMQAYAHQYCNSGYSGNYGCSASLPQNIYIDWNPIPIINGSNLTAHSSNSYVFKLTYLPPISIQF